MSNQTESTTNSQEEKPQYEAPVVMPLGATRRGLAQGACGTGSAATESCSTGPSADQICTHGDVATHSCTVGTPGDTTP